MVQIQNGLYRNKLKRCVRILKDFEDCLYDHEPSKKHMKMFNTWLEEAEAECKKDTEKKNEK